MEEASAVIVDNGVPPYDILEEESSSFLPDLELTPLQRIHLKLSGKVFIKKIQLKNWTNSLPLYAFNCPVHGLQSTYPMGWKKTLICPKCISDQNERES